MICNLNENQLTYLRELHEKPFNTFSIDVYYREENGKPKIIVDLWNSSSMVTYVDHNASYDKFVKSANAGNFHLKPNQKDFSTNGKKALSSLQILDLS